MTKGKQRQSKPRSFTIKHDESLAIQLPAYNIQWEYKRLMTKHVSNIVKELIEDFEIYKLTIYRTAKMSKNSLECYLNIPDNYVLTQLANERMAVTIALIVPDVVIHLKGKYTQNETTNIHRLHIFSEDKELDDFMNRYIEAFGTFGKYIVSKINSRKQLIALRDYYHDAFTKHTNIIL